MKEKLRKVHEKEREREEEDEKKDGTVSQKGHTSIKEEGKTFLICNA